eukprot:scaffold54479_cov59-Attheya_sp.AAC.2
MERNEWWEVGRNYLLGRYEASGGGVWRSRKGTDGGKRDETVFWGATKPVVVCGAAVGERGWTE